MTHTKSSTPCGLYAITPEHYSLNELIEWAEILLASGCQWFQYRKKQIDFYEARKEASALLNVLNRQGGRLIINDDVELAIDIGAHGVHLGIEDSHLVSVRERYSRERLMVGISCYQSLERALEAQRLGADYVAFGSVFSSNTKPLAVRASLSLFREATDRLQLPRIAIGGITPDNALAVLEAGASAIAVIQALANKETIKRISTQFQQLIQARRMCHDEL